MNRLIYVETSIPILYFETRSGAQMQARREWTREWWDLAAWNCKHLANPNKIEHIRMVNSALGIHTPQLLTPLEILEATL